MQEVRTTLEELANSKNGLKQELEALYNRITAYRRWINKYENKFHLHFDGEFKIKNGELEGTGGHNHAE